jgi:hypothetical protein
MEFEIITRWDQRDQALSAQIFSLGCRAASQEDAFEASCAKAVGYGVPGALWN